MKLVKGSMKTTSDDYRNFVAAEYRRLEMRKAIVGSSGGLEEIKLRLFLSLLDKPNTSFAKRAANQ